MGSAFKRCDYNPKKWMIDTTITFSDGSRRHLKRRGYNTKSEAIADYDRVVAAFQKQSGFNPSKSFFNDLIDVYLDFESNRVKESTFIARRTIFNLYITPFFKKSTIKTAFTLGNLNKFKKLIKELDLSVNRKNKILSEMRLLAKFAYNREFINERDFKHTNLVCEPFPSEIKELVRYQVWSFNQYSQFIKTFDSEDKHKVFFQFMFYSGVRIGEALAIQWKDFDVDNQLVYIYKSATNKNRTGGTTITTLRLLLLIVLFTLIKT